MDLGIKDGLSWLGAVFFLLWAFSVVGTSFFAGLIALCFGIFLIPDVRTKLRNEYDLQLSGSQLVIALAIAVFLISALGTGGTTTAPATGSNSATEQDYQELQSDYEELRNEHQQLQQDYNSLESTSVSQEKYQELKEKVRYSVSPPYVVAEDRSYKVAFVTLDDEPAFYIVDAETFEAQITTGTWMRQLSVQQMEYLGFNSMASDFDGGTKYQRLGNHGRYYQLEPFMVPENFGTISSDIYNRHGTDQQRVREVWKFVTQINTYSTEIEETPRMPMETLLMGGGDCEDTAILAASMLKAMPADWDVQLVYMDADRPEDPQTIDHVLVYVDTGEHQTFIETTSNTNMVPYDSVNGYYVDV